MIDMIDKTFSEKLEFLGVDVSVAENSTYIGPVKHPLKLVASFLEDLAKLETPLFFVEDLLLVLQKAELLKEGETYRIKVKDCVIAY